MTTGPRIKRAVTVETKRTTVYIITAADIRKRFRLPDDAAIVAFGCQMTPRSSSAFGRNVWVVAASVKR